MVRIVTYLQPVIFERSPKDENHKLWADKIWYNLRLDMQSYLLAFF